MANIGEDARHWKEVDEATARTFGLNLEDMNNLLVGRQGLYDEATLEDEGYDEKRGRLVQHYAFALMKNEVEKLLTTGEIMAMVDAGEAAGDADGDE